MWPTQSTELTRARLIAWLSDSEAAALGAGALRRSGHWPSAVAEALHAVTEAPASTSSLVILVEDAKRQAGLPAASAAIERWLLAHAAAAMLSAAHMPLLGDAVLERTCADIAQLLDDTWATAETLRATGIRFREFAKMATGRRFSAGLFHWDVVRPEPIVAAQGAAAGRSRPGVRTGETSRPRTRDVSTPEPASPAGPSRGAGDQRCARRDG